MGFQKGGLTALLAGALISLAGISAYAAEPVDMLRRIPLPVEGYASGRAFPTQFTTSPEILRVLDNTPVILVHMEALRRTVAELPPAEQEKLLRALSTRHLAKENDLTRYFDLGYAQLILKNNKSGLFFLRKASDATASPQAAFFNLAYGMAQVEADLTMEAAKPDQVTTRKMDATYRLGDAVKLDARKHQPGFWPAFVRVIEAMKPIPAYHSFVRRDFSLSYVPPGKKAAKPSGLEPATPLPPAAFPAAARIQDKHKSRPGRKKQSDTVFPPPSCDPQGDEGPGGLSDGPMQFQQSAEFVGEPMQIRFFSTSENHRYRVRVVDRSGRTTISFLTKAIPGPILEDLEGDGIPEIVVRQYAEDPLHPVLVYRYTPCGLELDPKIANFFQ